MAFLCEALVIEAARSLSLEFIFISEFSFASIIVKLFSCASESIYCPLTLEASGVVNAIAFPDAWARHARPRVEDSHMRAYLLFIQHLKNKN